MSATPRPARRRRWILLGVAGAIVLAVVLLVFEPQTLFIDTRVDDAFPGAAATEADPAPTTDPAPTATDSASAAAASASPAPEPEPADPVVVATGVFISRDHPTSGTATVYELADGGRVLRFDDLVTDNGPDLKVYLSTAAPDAPATEFDEQFVDLGVLAGNLGNQNYDVPVDVDLTAYRSVVIWCDRFDVPFGAAPLA